VKAWSGKSAMRQNNLFQRAAELIDELTNHPSRADEQIIKALDANDLQEIYRLVLKYESELAQEHFKNWNVAGAVA
jgi:hypothetical protein